MILRKPYAFIIRHFRLIHISVLVCLVFLFINFNAIYQLYATLQKTNTFIYPLAENTINNAVYLFIIVALSLSGILYWLLKEKKKPTRLYFLIIMDLIISAIAFVYLFYTLDKVANNTLEGTQIILYKDLSFLFMLPLYPIMGFCLVRGIGFNLKQFNFSKDIAELKIVDEDSEEFELLIGQNSYKYKRTIRRAFREAKYYYKENKFAILSIVGVICLFLAGSGLLYYNQYLKKLKEEESTFIDGISYTVNKSYITKKDYKGKLVRKNYKYIVVNMTFFNSSFEAKTLDLNKITLSNKGLLYYPTQTKNEKFYDLGLPYINKQLIPSSESLNATLTFEVPDTVNSKRFSLNVEYDLRVTDKYVKSDYKQFGVNAKDIDEDTKLLDRKLDERITTDVVGQNRFSIELNRYTLMDSFDHKYVICKTESNCRTLNSLISTTNITSDTMLVIDYNSEFFEDALFTKQFNDINKLIEGFVELKYRVYNQEFSEKARIVANSDVENKIFLAVDRRIVDATKIEVYFYFRNEVYAINLRERKV